MGTYNIHECFECRIGRSHCCGFSEMGAHKIRECLDSRIGHSQHLGSQSWALTIYISVLSVGMGAHNVGVPRNGRSQ